MKRQAKKIIKIYDDYTEAAANNEKTLYLKYKSNLITPKCNNIPRIAYSVTIKEQ